MFYYDSTYILVLIGAVICLLASNKVNRTFNKFSQVRNQRGVCGREAAEHILRVNNIYDVQVVRVAGNLTDHYDPKNKVLRLSDVTYGSDSVAAISVAAHECGHAIQHHRSYLPLVLRSTLVPVANIGASAAWPLILIGLFLNGNTAILLINLGILAFSASVLFQLVTLPVEFNASRRAMNAMQQANLLYGDEVRQAKKVLSAAALTYVASAAASLLQLLRLIMIGGRRRD